jgi:hypothetical protein
MATGPELNWWIDLILVRERIAGKKKEPPGFDREALAVNAGRGGAVSA